MNTENNNTDNTQENNMNIYQIKERMQAVEQHNKDLGEDITKLQLELSSKQVQLDRVSAIGERNASRLREALTTIRFLIGEARDNDERFVRDHRDSIDQLVSFGMEDFTKSITVNATFTVTLSTTAIVPDSFDEDDIEIGVREEEDIFEGAWMDSPDIDVDEFSYEVETRSFRMQENN